MQEDTICALATATGGALGIIRISGPKSLEILTSICNLTLTEAKGNTIHYTHIRTPQGDIIDEVMVSVFRAPHSYTGEDSAEISCHGSSYIMNKLLELLLQQGCRLANPGEFTQRAFLNGKMDLSQAEAVADLIASTNKATHQMAMSQLRGHFSSELALLRDQLLHLTTLLELELDFSDHEELEFADRTELLELSQQIEKHIAKLISSFETGQAMKQGVPVAIVGKTNVGKSTLLNRLAKEDRAIVSDIHGTTRDTIEDAINIQGVQFRFIDTAGLRHTDDKVEQIGIERTYQTIQKARIVLWLFDDVPTKEETDEIRKRCEGRTLIPIHNKADIQSPANISDMPSLLNISAKRGDGLSALEQRIYEAADIPELKENDVVVSNARHYEALLRAQADLQRVIEGMKTNLPSDLIAEDLRQVLSHLGEITGGNITSQEVLNNVFSHFCVGK